VKVFPNCTEVAIDNCDAENVLRGIGGPVNEIVAARSVFPDSLLQQGRAYFSKLTRLEAVECGWKAIPPLLKDVPHLTALNLSGNQIEAIENLGNCRHLAALDLSHNNLQSVEGLFETSGESCPSALTELDLSHNPLVSLKGLGPWLSNLVSLNLEQCKVSDWLGEINRISRFTTLKSVNLAGSPAYYNLAVGVTSPRQAIIDIMTELTDANDFAIDGVRLSKSEYKSWQVSAGRQKASDSGAQDAEHDESEWPVASGSPPATILLEPETNQPKSVKIVKRRVKSGKSGKNDDNKSGSCDGLQSPVRKGKSGLSKRRVETIDRGVETHRVKKAGVACQATLGAAAGNDFQTEIFQRVQKRIEAPQYRAAHGTALKSWSNGLTLCALLHCCNRSWIDFHNLAPAKSSANVKKAVDVAYAKLGVPKPALGCDFVQDLPQLAAYTALLLIAIQEWEGEQYRKSKQLNERLIAEVERYRVQRQKDKVTLLGEQGNIAAARSLNLSMRPSQDSISSDDNDSTH
ncbi:Dynein light chain 1, partial [Diplonema papillatum]